MNQKFFSSSDWTTVVTLMYFREMPADIVNDPNDKRKKIFLFHDSVRLQELVSQLKAGTLKVDPFGLLEASKRARRYIAEVDYKFKSPNDYE